MVGETLPLINEEFAYSIACACVYLHVQD